MNDTQSAKPLSPRHHFLDWWSGHVQTTVDHADVVERVRADGGWNSHYAFMILMSAGIAVLGLLLSSPAVVIGAMLISPLMGPIVGLGFALAVFDAAEIRRSLNALVLGILLAILFCALIVLVSPLQTVTDEIAARTRPNLFDLLVALFSGLAGSYAMIRGRHGAIVGVAIATSLMPPLATVGFGLATANSTVFFGSSLLFFTNMMIIAIAAAVMARLYRFAHHLSPRQTRLQATLIVLTFLALAIPLGLSLRQIAWETLASRQAREVIAGLFGAHARVSEISIDYDARPINVEATVLTPEFRRGAEAEARRRLETTLRKPIDLTIDQFRVGGETDAEAAVIAQARGVAADRGRARLAERLALIAGVAPDDVLVDRVNKRARVRAAPLPGASLASYQALEARVSGIEPGWSVALVPPAAPLPDVAFDGEQPTEAGARALAIAAWAAQRLALPVGVAGEDAEAVVEALQAQGVAASLVAGDDAPGARLTWLAPVAEPQE